MLLKFREIPTHVHQNPFEKQRIELENRRTREFLAKITLKIGKNCKNSEFAAVQRNTDLVHLEKMLKVRLLSLS